MPFRYDDVMSDVRCLDAGVAIEKHFLFSNSKHLRETTDSARGFGGAAGFGRLYLKTRPFRLTSPTISLYHSRFLSQASTRRWRNPLTVVVFVVLFFLLFEIGLVQKMERMSENQTAPAAMESARKWVGDNKLKTVGMSLSSLLTVSFSL